MLDYLVETLGSDKITLGTDYPFPLGELEPGQLIRSMPYSEDVKARMLGQNALDWLGLRQEHLAKIMAATA
ncbi:amidohydrolase [Hymenobacter sp. AT01-02]|nr:amidohydrolase [Hymenobacter sp. AT01-02]